jgi:hypothetical protein
MTIDLAEIRDEVLRKIGRNVILFQELEHILKFLASAQHPSTPMSKAMETRAERTDSIRVQSLGQIAGQVVEELFAAPDDEASAPTEITEPWLSFSFRIAIDESSSEDTRKTLKALIDERNQLVHHLLSRWNLRDAEGCGALSHELDQQRLRIVRETDRFRAYANTISQMANELQAFIDSDDGRRQFDLMFLQSSRLAMLLAEIATTQVREDGWTLLSVAGSQLSSLVPEQFEKLKREHGEGSLRKLVAAIGLFDLQFEPTPNGGMRALYRARDSGRAEI